MENFSFREIGILKPISSDFVAHDGSILYAVSYWSTDELKTIRFVSFVPDSALPYFEQLSSDAKIRALFHNELSKDELSLMLCEYRFVSSIRH